MEDAAALALACAWFDLARGARIYIHSALGCVVLFEWVDCVLFCCTFAWQLVLAQFVLQALGAALCAWNLRLALVMIHRLKVVVKVISVMIMAAVMLQIYRIDPLNHKTLNAILAAKFAIITTESHDAVSGYLFLFLFLLPT